jgi:DNA-binding IclR family transcriptional regulator
MASFDESLQILRDGEWHNLDEVIEVLHLPEVNGRKILLFLREFGFVVFDKEERKVRIDREFQKFYEG